MRFGTVLSALMLVLSTGVAGCSKPPVLTDNLRERYALGQQDLRRVQLFTSDEIVLRREISAEEKSVSGSELRVRGGVREEEVVIPARTPCVALRVEGSFVLVGFATGYPALSLWFGLDTKSEPSPEGRRYTLAPIANAPNEQPPVVPLYAKGFLVTYGGRKYRVIDTRSWNAHLLVDIEESFARNRVRQEAPGWRLSEQAVPAGTFSAPSLPLAPGAGDPSPSPPARDAGATP